MKITSKGNKAPNVTKLNPWGGVRNNEQQSNQGNRGFSGKQPDIYACDTTNEQTAAGKKFKGFTPNRGNIDYRLGGVTGGPMLNENPKGFKQGNKPKAYKPSGT